MRIERASRKVSFKVYHLTVGLVLGWVCTF
jgi:hypothetical protein